MGSLSDQSDSSSSYYEVVVPAYQSSKAALNVITVAMAKLLKDTPIKINSVCPGWVQTDLGDKHLRRIRSAYLVGAGSVEICAPGGDGDAVGVWLGLGAVVGVKLVTAGVWVAVFAGWLVGGGGGSVLDAGIGRTSR
jgi:NAD(P)-dependent dehydrogenase (short-subunit alcohol dehydrogenase family)